MVAVLVGILSSRQPIPNLNVPESLARFVMVALGEVLAFSIFISPLLFIASYKSTNWAIDCLHYGSLIAAPVILIIIIFLALSLTVLSDAAIIRWTEYLIVTIYFLNILGLSAAIIRTWGPAKSLYASLLPIQLAGFILLELQKDRWILEKEQKDQTRSPSGYLVVIFAILTTVAWLTSSVTSLTWLEEQLPTIFTQPGAEEQKNFSAAITLINIAGTVLTALGYFLPRQQWFFKLPRLRKSEHS